MFMLGTCKLMFMVSPLLWVVIAGERFDYSFISHDVMWKIIGVDSVVGATYKVMKIIGYTVEDML